MTGTMGIPDEQGRNIDYLEQLRTWLSGPVHYVMARSRTWVAPSTNVRGKSYDALHPLIGRVGLDAVDADLGESFYIGSTHVRDGDPRVFSWAAPVARLFFAPDESTDSCADRVVVRRTFSHRLDAIVDLDDEWVRETDADPFRSEALSVPAPPPSALRRRPSRDSTPAVSRADEYDTQRAASAEPAPMPETIAAGMRARETVRKRMAVPRSDRLSSVLATLQPDQYELVSRPADDYLIVQGHPGTGKTIVAAYRACFLTLEGEDGQPAVEGRLLLVGPTAAYVKHVEGLVRPLDVNHKVTVTHLEELLDSTAGLKGRYSGGIGGEHDDVDVKARGLADQAARVLATRGGPVSGPNARRTNIKAIYDLIASNGGAGPSLTNDPDRVVWMRKLPPFERAVLLRRYLPLMAQCRLAFSRVPVAEQYDHIVVDEAQDVSPIEWNVLEQVLARGGTWSLVGDTNQRRSDTSYGSWQQIADHLGLGDGTSPGKVDVMSRGYRSTGRILRFADKLLPARERGNLSIQTGGAEVAVRRARPPETLGEVALREADRLTRAHPDGTVAILTVDPGMMIMGLGKRGWRRPGQDHHTWKRLDRSLRLFVPEDARGLEFDAVVVVEPGAFPENLGRAGQLYTSLTRANRELAVVWSRALPDELRKAARR